MYMIGCVALSGVTTGQGQGWPEPQVTSAATVDQVWNACLRFFRLVWAETLVRE